MPPETSDDTVGRSFVLDLQHLPLARGVRVGEPLGDDSIEAGALEPIEPVCRRRAVASCRREVDLPRRAGQH